MPATVQRLLLLLPLLGTGTSAVAAHDDAPQFDIEPFRLAVAIVHDPDFPPLEAGLIASALDHASVEFQRRFDARAPTFEVVNEFSVSGFLGAYALPVDPRCQPLYAARYRGGGKEELDRYRERALGFFKRWSLDSLKGFIDEETRAKIKSYDDIYAYYIDKYTTTVESMRNLKTPQNTPLVEPGQSAERSFVAWTCALLRQEDYDVVITNTFILADLMTEPHPHAVFGKAKIGGIAARSPGRSLLDGQALLATTFGIDTKIPQFMELKGDDPIDDERSKILGAYLLAHEVAHAIFGIPDVFDHPEGCLMTSRPGASYRDGLRELEAHVVPCPRCRPYVEARAHFDRGRQLQREGKYRAATAYLMKAAKSLPKHFHGGRKQRMSQILVSASQSYDELGKRSMAKKYAELAVKLTPSSQLATDNLDRILRPQTTLPMPVPIARTASTATIAPTAGTRTIEAPPSQGGPAR